MWNSTVCTQQQDKKKKKSNIQITECSFLTYFLSENLTTMSSYMHIYICTYVHMYLITVSNISKNLWRKSGNCQSYNFFFFLPRYSGIDTECNRSWWWSQLVMIEFPPIEGKETPLFNLKVQHTLVSGISLFVMLTKSI